MPQRGRTWESGGRGYQGSACKAVREEGEKKSVEFVYQPAVDLQQNEVILSSFRRHIYYRNLQLRLPCQTCIAFADT